MKAKKVLAMLMASAMIMGTSVTAFAAVGTAKITVNNLDENASITAVQVIKPDRETETGWTFASEDAKNAYGVAFGVSADGVTDEEAQDIIWKLIWYTIDAEGERPSVVPADIASAASATQIKDALDNLTDSTYTNTGVVDNVITVSNAGIYAIKATTTDTEHYVYGDMAAYVSFGYNTSGVPESLTNTTVNAKRTTLTIEKTSSEDDQVVGISDTVMYTVETFVPYFNDAEDNVTYQIVDKLSGAEYVRTDEEGKYVSVAVYLGDVTTETQPYKTVSVEVSDVMEEGVKTGETFTIDLSDIAEDRSNANSKLTLKYEATVTSEVVNNTVQPNDGENTFDSITDSEVLYTGKITMTKYGEENAEGERPELAGATFIVYTKNPFHRGDYATFEKDETAEGNEYVLTGWTWNKDDPKTKVTTGADGTLVVRGLDDSFEYLFDEVEAPEGYSINEEDAKAKWDEKGEGAVAATRAGSASMNDTKLSSLPLPATGGVGTTMFTVGGCTIMVVAAGLYFATRKKVEK